MAVLSVLQGLEVTVTVNGVPLEEHRDSEESEETSTKAIRYIPVQSGAEFAVQVVCKPPFRYMQNELDVRLIIDGIEVDDSLMKRNDIRTLQQTRRLEFDSVGHCKGQTWGNSKLKFANIVTDETAPKATKSTIRKLADIGEIQVVLRRVHATLCKAFDPIPTSMKPKLFGNRRLSEKALKGRSISHRASLGTFRPAPAPDFYKYEYIGNFHDPLAMFVFRYRSLESLKKQLIIPRTPPPVPLEERDVNDLSLEEARELIQKQKATIDNNATLIKRERTMKRQRGHRQSISDDSGSDLEVTTAKPSKSLRHGDVLDLTED